MTGLETFRTRFTLNSKWKVSILFLFLFSFLISTKRKHIYIFFFCLLIRNMGIEPAQFFSKYYNQENEDFNMCMSIYQSAHMYVCILYCIYGIYDVYIQISVHEHYLVKVDLFLTVTI